MDFKRITTTAELDALAGDWRALLQRSHMNSLPTSFEWVRAWWGVFGRYHQMAVACAFKDDKLVAAAPLVTGPRKYRGINVSMASLMTNTHTPYSDVVLDDGLSDEEKTRFFSDIIASSPEDILQFTCVRNDGCAQRYAREAARRCGRSIGTTPNLMTPVIKAHEEWDAFMLGRSKKFRRGIRNKLNRFEKAGLRVEKHEISSNVEEYLSRIIAVSGRSWKADAGTDLLSCDDARELLDSLVTVFATLHDVDLWMAYDGDRPVAYELHIVYHGRSYPFRADFDEDYRRVSPGSVVEYEALKGVFDGDYAHTYFSCADDYAYLAHWTEDYVQFCDLELFAPNLKARSLYFFEYKLMPIYRVLRDRARALARWRPARTAHMAG